jgi:hypothetical protein
VTAKKTVGAKGSSRSATLPLQVLYQDGDSEATVEVAVTPNSTLAALAKEIGKVLGR